MIIASSSSAELPLILVLQKRCIWGTIWSLWCGTWFWCASHLNGYDFNQMVTVFGNIFFLVPPMFAFRAQFLGRHSSVFETSRRKLQQTDPKEERLYRETIRWSDAGNRFGDGKASMITQRSKSSSADLDWSSCLWRRFRVEDLCRRALLNHVMLNHSFFSYLLSMFIHFHPQFLLWYFFSSSANHALVNQQTSPWQGRKVWF